MACQPALGLLAVAFVVVLFGPLPSPVSAEGQVETRCFISLAFYDADDTNCSSPSIEPPISNAQRMYLPDGEAVSRGSVQLLADCPSKELHVDGSWILADGNCTSYKGLHAKATFISGDGLCPYDNYQYINDTCAGEPRSSVIGSTEVDGACLQLNAQSSRIVDCRSRSVSLFNSTSCSGEPRLQFRHDVCLGGPPMGLPYYVRFEFPTAAEGSGVSRMIPTSWTTTAVALLLLPLLSLSPIGA